MLIVHDFIAENDKSSPREAALWFLTCIFNCPDAIVLTPERVEFLARQAGFKGISTSDLIPGLTRVPPLQISRVRSDRRAQHDRGERSS